MVKLNQLIERLCDADIDFVIVGGFAGVLHGSSLLTRDLHVCTVLSSEAVAKLRDTFRDLQPKHRFTTEKFSFLDAARTASNSPTPLMLPIEIELFGRRCRVALG